MYAVSQLAQMMSVTYTCIEFLTQLCYRNTLGTTRMCVTYLTYTCIKTGIDLYIRIVYRCLVSGSDIGTSGTRASVLSRFTRNSSLMT